MWYALLLCSLSIRFSDGFEVKVDTSQANDLAGFASQAKQAMEQWYPIIRNFLHSPTYKDVSTLNLKLDAGYGGVAFAVAKGTTGDIVGAAKYYREHPEDVGSMIHELTHIVQNYQNCPGWLTEGIADYVRYYIYAPGTKSGTPGPEGNYTYGYDMTAYFLNYIVTKVRPDMIYWANKDCREGKYDDSLWKRLTGKDLNTMWNDMYRGDGKFKVNVDSSKTPDLYEFGQRVKERMEKWYKPLRDLLYSPSYKEIYEIWVTFDPNQKGGIISSTQGARITAGADFARFVQSPDPFVETMISFMQIYNANTPPWVKSGIQHLAYYHVYKGEELEKPGTDGGIFAQYENYNSGGEVSAYFFNYVKNNVRSDIINQISEAARKGVYQDALWQQLTGKDLPTLWDDMKRNG